MLMGPGTRSGFHDCPTGMTARMKILLAVSLSNERFHVIPDIGLGYLASLAREAGHEVCFVDCLRDELGVKGWQNVLRKEGPDLVGIKSYSADLESVADMVRCVKEIAPNMITVIGGAHPSTEIPANLFEQFPGLDYAISGEGEPGWVPFLNQMDSGGREFDAIPGLIWQDVDGAIRHNPKSFAHDLDAVPFPAWDLLDPGRYKWGYSFMTSKYPAAPMILTRGCPYLCTFCGSHLITGRKVRKRSVDNVIEEIKLLIAKYGIRSIDIVDENFVFVRKHAMEFCERLLSENIEIAWNCPYGVRLDRLDEELVRMMERAGCFALSLGIESGSDRQLAQIQKVLTVEKTVEQVNMIKRVSNITLQGFFMMGLPGETKEEIEATIALAVSLPLDLAIFTPLRVTPGTAIYDELVNAGTIHPRVDYAGMGQHYFVRSYSEISDTEMKKLYRKAYIKFYFRPKQVVRVLSKVRSRAQAYTIANGLYRLFQRPFLRFDPRKHASRKESTIES